MDAGRRIILGGTNETILFVREYGPLSGAPVICIPGISSTGAAFAAIAERLAGAGRRVVAVDLRGRGHSPTSGAGSYGWPAHARDVANLISHLGDEPADVIGHSMGGFVAMTLCALAPASVDRLVVVDALRKPPVPVLAAVRSGLDRLGQVFCSISAYTEACAQRRGTIDAVWEAHDIADLETVPGGVRARTNREACFDDAEYLSKHDARDYWPALPAKTLLVRAVSGFARDSEQMMVPQLDIDELRRLKSQARCLDVDANHYTVLTKDAALTAIVEYLS